MNNHTFIKRFCSEPYALERVLSELLEAYWTEASRRLGREIPPVVAPVPEIRKFLKSENQCDVDLIQHVMQKRKDRDAFDSNAADVADRLEIESLIDMPMDTNEKENQ